MSENGDAYPSTLLLKIGHDGISCIDFIPLPSVSILAVGTCGGRIRLFNLNSQTDSSAIYQERWHKSIRCLAFNPDSPNICITASAQRCIKVHDTNTGQRIASFNRLKEAAPFSALLPLADHRWVTGDDDGSVKIWDDRRSDGVCSSTKLFTEEEAVAGSNDLRTINDFAVGMDSQGLLLVAVDSGCLVTYNVRRRKTELISEPLGYSARSVITVKDNKKVLVGTDEGVVVTYNWKEFGSVCDRFPVRTSRSHLGQNSTKTMESGLPAVEKIAKISEDIVVVGTDDGALSAVNILPNRVLSCLGWHTAGSSGDSGLGGDCMDLAVSPSFNFIGSCLPSSSAVRFWSTEQLLNEASHEVSLLSMPKKRRSSSSKTALSQSKHAKSRFTSKSMDQNRVNFLSGFQSYNSIEDDVDTDSDSEDSAD